MTGSGIAACASHLPFWQLTGATVVAALGKRASPAVRAVASHGQDTTLAAETARVALSGAPTGTAEDIGALASATTPVYAGSTNSAAIHAALGLRGGVRASDAGASGRSGTAALIAALRSRELTWPRWATSTPEACGDAAAAFIAGEPDEVVPVPRSQVGERRANATGTGRCRGSRGIDEVEGDSCADRSLRRRRTHPPGPGR
jgi:hydroxymethylglutaryl-CoA synthase